MKKSLFTCLLLFLTWSSSTNNVWAIDAGWMQRGVRIWYLGGVGSGTSSNAEEAYLFNAIEGNNAQVTRHSALTHWTAPNLPETQTYSISGMGPCWIHPQRLQTLVMGDHWMGWEITLITRSTYTYDMLPYAFLPAKALFDLKPQREIVKIIYMIAGYSTGTAYIDAETGLVLQYSKMNGYVLVFFILSEINYNFVSKAAFAEDDGPHTGFKSMASEQSMNYSGVGGGTFIVQSLVETRYGNTLEMRALGSVGKSPILQSDENYCFFGDVPVLKRMNATEAPDYPPEQWNEIGQYLWWWLPKNKLNGSTINIFDISMERTNTAPYTFTATQQKTGFYFTEIVFNNDGYMTQFSAKDSITALDIKPSDNVFQNLTTVNGPDYYKNTMGIAVPDPDGDHDGMPDEWEVTYFTDTTRDGAGDYDDDELTDINEYLKSSYPNDTDSDDDGLTDGDEVNTYGTNPVLADTDSDSMRDNWEVLYNFDPLDPTDASDDADSDGFTNYKEYKKGTNPEDPDSHPVRPMVWLPLLLE
jgi:hypothetical protein